MGTFGRWITALKAPFHVAAAVAIAIAEVIGISKPLHATKPEFWETKSRHGQCRACHTYTIAPVLLGFV